MLPLNIILFIYSTIITFIYLLYHTTLMAVICVYFYRVYVWTDDQGKKLKCSAPLYFDYALSYIQDLLTDEDVFPTKAGSVFPAGFVFLVQKVFLLLFRTLAHIYWSHYRETLALGLHPHLNTLFTHLTHFCQQHSLLEPEDTEPLQDLITALGQYILIHSAGGFEGLEDESWFLKKCQKCSHKLLLYV
uniref:MOB kinase activator 2-like n=1 Tax=Myripristis murdjan TaxID=586833 RepID=A0A667ZF29_9TELE